MEQRYRLWVAAGSFGWFASVIVCGCVLLLAAAPCALSQTASTSAQQVTNELPPCSVLREQMEQQIYGEGIAKSYMEAMRSQGVKRAFFEVDATWRSGKPIGLQVVHRLYFDQFDGPDSQIVDSTRLAQIEQNGLEAALDRVARERVMHAPLFVGFELKTNPDGKRMYSYVDLFANPWLPEPKVLVSPVGTFPPAVVHAAMMGNLLTVESQLKKGQISQRELNNALFQAVGNRYDNTAVIKALIDAGADVNAHGPDGVTPLMSAVAHPCNIPPLLNAGADVNARDKWGRDALRLAREVKQPVAVRLLEEAAGNKHIEGGG
jgi:Ankyrin repeat